MQKKSPNYDDVFKTTKTKHREFFIPLINEIYRTHFQQMMAQNFSPPRVSGG